MLLKNTKAKWQKKKKRKEIRRAEKNMRKEKLK